MWQALGRCRRAKKGERAVIKQTIEKRREERREKLLKTTPSLGLSPAPTQLSRTFFRSCSARLSWSREQASKKWEDRHPDSSPGLGNENAIEESELALFLTSSFHFISPVLQPLTNFPGVKFSRTASKLGKEKQNPFVTYPRYPQLVELGSFTS